MMIHESIDGSKILPDFMLYTYTRYFHGMRAFKGAAPRIVNEVSYVMMIKQASQFVVLCSTQEFWTSTL